MSDLAAALRRMLPDPPTTNYGVRRLKTDIRALLAPSPLIFDIGSKEARGAYLPGGPPPGARIVCVDIDARPGVDLVADAHDLHMVETGTVDLVMLLNVLEHVRDPQRVLAECERILKPGGIVWVDVPFMFPFHADPDDFWRFSDRGLEVACGRFEKIECTFLRGPASCMAELIVQFVAVLFSFNRRRLHSAAEYAARWLFSWIKYLDWFIANYESARVIHATTTFIGRKRAAAA